MKGQAQPVCTTAMRLTQIFQNEYARLEAGPTNMFVRLTWLQHVSGEPFRQALQATRQYSCSQGTCLRLNDMRKLSYVTVADQLWTVKEYLPAFGWRSHYRTACVVSPQNVDFIPDTLIQEWLGRSAATGGTMELAVFLDMEEAKSWLFL